MLLEFFQCSIAPFPIPGYLHNARPLSASFSVAACPIPDVAPVITTTLPRMSESATWSSPLTVYTLHSLPGSLLSWQPAINRQRAFRGRSYRQALWPGVANRELTSESPIIQEPCI